MSQTFNKKSKIFKIIIIIALAALFIKLIQLQVICGNFYQEQAKLNMLRRIKILASRGIIYDRYGVIIVKNIPQFSVILIPEQLRGVPQIVDRLSKILKKDKNYLYKWLKNSIACNLVVIKVKDIVSHQTFIKVEEARSQMPGIYVQIQPQREYCHNSVSAHLLGYIGEINKEELEKFGSLGYKLGDTLGKQGIEKYYDKYLRGSNGAKLLQVDARGNIVRELSEIAPKKGNNLYLTIDYYLQQKSEESLKRVLNSLARRNITRVAGAVVVISPKTGEILVLASLPQVDPNIFVKGISQSQYQDLIKNKFYPLLNRATATAVPPASTFKIITASACLQENITSLNSSFHCPGVYRVGDMNFHCFLRSGHGSISFIDAIAKSCDVAFYKLGEKLGPEKINKYAKEFGLGSLTGIDLYEEVSGTVPNRDWKEKIFNEPWYIGDTINFSIGQGYLEATPLQLALATCVVANDGYLFKPFIVKKIVSPNGEIVSENKSEIIRQVSISSKNLETVRLGMRQAVINGTAVAANLNNIEVAGKTGTAENRATPSNPYGRNHTWFTCMAPYKSPEIVVAVFLEQSGGYGGEIAAPVAKEILQAYFRRKQGSPPRF